VDFHPWHAFGPGERGLMQILQQGTRRTQQNHPSLQDPGGLEGRIAALFKEGPDGNRPDRSGWAVELQQGQRLCRGRCACRRSLLGFQHGVTEADQPLPPQAALQRVCVLARALADGAVALLEAIEKPEPIAAGRKPQRLNRWIQAQLGHVTLAFDHVGAQDDEAGVPLQGLGEDPIVFAAMAARCVEQQVDAHGAGPGREQSIEDQAVDPPWPGPVLQAPEPGIMEKIAVGRFLQAAIVNGHDHQVGGRLPAASQFLERVGSCQFPLPHRFGTDQTDRGAQHPCRQGNRVAAAPETSRP
jgi:hypothetical protein